MSLIVPRKGELTEISYMGLYKMLCPSIQMVDCPRTKQGKLLQDMNILQNKMLIYISIFIIKF
jgi:hypothetical protein